MKKLYALFLSFLVLNASAQIIAPDTVCVGTTVNFTTPKTATTYSWEFSPVNVVQPISPIRNFASGFTSAPTFACFNKDGANYYCFVADYNSEHLFRLSYGTNIHSVPVITDLGTLGMSAGRLEGVDIVKDTATGQWYGIIVDNSSMGILSFGTSLSSAPTCVVTSYPSLLFWTHQVTIKRWHGNWTAFVANRNATITRFDFGSSLTNPPIVNALPNVGSVYTPCNFTLYEQAGQWYMLVTSLITAIVTRYDFGTNLLNNTPTGTVLPSPPGMLYLPRYINLLNDCNGNLIGYLGNETGNIIRLDFGGNITNMPTYTVVGSAGSTTINGGIPCAFDDTFSILTIDYTGRILQYIPFNFTPQTFINYYNPVQPYTYTTTGTFPVSLFCDMGYHSGPYVYCKNIVVVNKTQITSSRDTLLCPGTPFTLYADTIGKYLWSTTDTTFSITRSVGGTYWVTTETGRCRTKSDTVKVTYNTAVNVNLGRDTTICVGNSIILAPVLPAGAAILWSTGSTSPSINVSSSGTYWIRVSSGGCTGTDTIRVVVNPKPVVGLGPDVTVCSGTPVLLQATGSFVAPTYLWSDGSTSSSTNATTSGDYWLVVTDGGCSSGDTVKVKFKPTPQVFLGNDTTICPGTTLVLIGHQPAGALFNWSDGSTDSSIIVTAAGTYSLTVDLNGCKASATINVTIGATEVLDLGPDTTVCIGDEIILSVNNNNAIWSTGYVGSSIKVSYPKTYWVKLQEPCGIIIDSIKVDFHICDIGFPSAFTPNGDGKNDIIKVEGTLKYYSDYSLSIYNRWGERVFYTTDIYAGWDGIYNSTKQDLGTYFYMIYYTIHDKKHMMKGDFQLIR